MRPIVPSIYFAVWFIAHASINVELQLQLQRDVMEEVGDGLAIVGAANSLACKCIGHDEPAGSW